MWKKRWLLAARCVWKGTPQGWRPLPCQTLESLITLAEQRVGLPRRRVDLLYAQWEALKKEEQRWRDKADKPRMRAQGFEERAWELHFLIRQAQQEVEALGAKPVFRSLAAN